MKNRKLFTARKGTKAAPADRFLTGERRCCNRAPLFQIVAATLLPRDLQGIV
jgi:hypothetical protein